MDRLVHIETILRRETEAIDRRGGWSSGTNYLAKELLGALQALTNLHAMTHKTVEPWAAGYPWTGDHCAFDGEHWPCTTIDTIQKSLRT